MKSVNKWLKESVRVDVYGRPLNMSSAPMITTTRRNALMYKGYTLKQIYRMWEKATNG